MRSQLLHLIQLLPPALKSCGSNSAGSINSNSPILAGKHFRYARQYGTAGFAKLHERHSTPSIIPHQRWRLIYDSTWGQFLRRYALNQSSSRGQTGLEARVAAFINGLSLTPTGQGLFLACFPMTAVAMMFPTRFKWYSVASAEVPEAPEPAAIPAPAWRTFCSTIYQESAMLFRSAYLVCIFFPVVLASLGPLMFGVGQEQFNAVLKWCIERAGPAFIKWGQWASTRPDLFPQSTCEVLEQLQANSPSHKGTHSVDAIETAFGCPLSDLFIEFELEPVASGSIAQIHRAKLSEHGAKLTGRRPGELVAVKVRHPSVSTVMETDFALMMRAAQLASSLPAMRNMRLDESVKLFGAPLREQLDLATEAKHLVRFQHNFRTWSNVSFPSPLYPLVHTDVLVESFEEGRLISHYVNAPVKSLLQGELAVTGLNLYLQMLLKDNFIHADLHPGNILVSSQHVWKPKLQWTLPFVQFISEEPKLVLLDTGMTAQLSGGDQRNLMKFFTALTKQDGANLAKSILLLSEQDNTTDKSAFIDDMAAMFEKLDAETIRQYTADVFRDMIETIRKHQVTLKSCVSTVVMTTLVLEGWSTKLNPDLRILDTMRDMLATDWVDRISNVVDRTMLSGSLAT